MEKLEISNPRFLKGNRIEVCCCSLNHGPNEQLISTAYQRFVIHCAACISSRFISSNIQQIRIFVVKSFFIELINHHNTKDSRNDIHLSETNVSSKSNHMKQKN